MSDWAISVREVSKRFRSRRPRGHALHEAFERAVRAPITHPPFGGGRTPSHQAPWALDNLSFEVKHGERVGLIGHNGAGKSVLMRILARVTRPTLGEADLVGRVSAVLEAGAGFNRELTGRENIYLNGAILGMRKNEITRRYDEIVAFSGMEAFVDQPLKTFSSGMSVRLAFAIAAQLEPDILLMDEVLAVADDEFRLACLERLKTLAREGRTILLVSHDIDMIAGLCPRTILLEHGQIVMDGETRQVAASYHAGSFS